MKTANNPTTMSEPKTTTESQVTIHYHEASLMWLAVIFAALFAALAAGWMINAWKDVEMARLNLETLKP